METLSDRSIETSQPVCTFICMEMFDPQKCLLQDAEKGLNPGRI